LSSYFKSQVGIKKQKRSKWIFFSNFFNSDEKRIFPIKFLPINFQWKKSKFDFFRRIIASDLSLNIVSLEKRVKALTEFRVEMLSALVKFVLVEVASLGLVLVGVK